MIYHIDIRKINVIYYKLKNENHICFSTDAEKASDKIQHPFMLKIPQNVGKEETYLNVVSAVCEKPTGNIILNSEKLKAFPPKSGTRRMSTLTTFIQYSLEVLAMAIRKEKEIKGIQIGKERKPLLFVDYMILHIEHPKNATKKLLGITNEFTPRGKLRQNTHKLQQ